MRLIDADALVKELRTKMNAHPVDSEIWLAYYSAAHTADTQPTVEAKVTLRDILDRVHLSQELIIFFQPDIVRDIAANVRKNHADWLERHANVIEGAPDGAIAITLF